ncbi:hypothetical protein WJX73_000402 [Symbiochloris irregularis]|uniref:DNA repair protein RAD50 n=1 Tax=Symbiochloris irregularis TaxID=706552 RepID=A0AAW1PH70_9CHLO
MCTIDKMLIKGIRSFSPNNTQVIEFYKPLTLIVGHNGAGKTTIIECLKQACTGELPPNVKSGQSFIHDPKIAGETEVKAQIKLRIRNANGSPIVIIRAFQLTQKKTALQFKAIDQTLQTHDQNGVKEALSYRCADIDRIIPGVMGVSKAILENVVFVHQEDSNWPLADGQTLKRNFDDIFAATKYTKALEALRKLRTEKVQEAKELKLKLAHLKTHKDTADGLKAEVQEGREKEASIVAQITSLDEQLRDKDGTIKGLAAILQQYRELGEQHTRLQTQVNILSQQNAEALEKVVAKYGDEVYDTTLEQLEEYSATIDNTFAEQQAGQKALLQEIRVLDSSMTALRSQCDKDMQAEASLKAAHEAHARNVVDRDDCMREVAASCGMADLAGIAQLSSEDIARFQTMFSDRMRGAEAALARLKQTNAQKDDEAGRRVDQATAEMSAAKEGVRAKQDQLRHNQNRQQQLQSQLVECAITPEALADVRGREDKARAALEAKRNRLGKLDADRQLEEMSARMRQSNRRLQTLRQERDQLLAQSEEATRMRLKQQELAKKQQQLNQVLNHSKPRLASVLGVAAADLPQADKVRQAVDNAVERCQDAAEEASAQLRHAQNRASTQEGALAAARSSLTKQEHQLANSQRQLQQGMLAILNKEEVPEALENCISQCEQDWNGKQNAQSRTKAMEMQHDFLKTHAQRQNECRSCARAFANSAEKQAFMHRQDQQKQQLPGVLAQLGQEISEKQEQLQKLRDLQPFWVKYDSLRNQDLPALQSRVQQLEAEVGTLKQQAQDMQQTCNQREQQLQEAQKRKQSRIKEDIAQATAEHHSVGREALEASQLADRQQVLQRDIMGLEEHSGQLGEAMQGLQSSMAGLDTRRQQLITEREGARAVMRQQEAEEEGRVRGLAAMRSQVESKQRPLDDYAARGGDGQLHSVTQRLTASRQRLQEKEAAVKDARIKEKQLQSDLVNQETTKFQIEAMLSLKRGEAQEAKHAADLQQVQTKMEGLGNYSQVSAEYRNLQADMQKLQREQDMKRGALESIRDSVQRATRSLSGAQYTDIDAKYGMQQIEMRTTEMAASDLEKYHKALEKALLAFHTSKMEDINKIVKELWQKTYRNQDIDYIQIKADADGARSYNYRVVMLSGGVSLDMRGRCSAGQKVLACLIIRLALAETFCLNCGILALDEPTTNLDAANAQSLAEALRQIMDSRRAQSNFQLVVITHDEKFAQLIGTREQVECMWRITKDINQHSTLAQESMAS